MNRNEYRTVLIGILADRLNLLPSDLMSMESVRSACEWLSETHDVASGADGLVSKVLQAQTKKPSTLANVVEVFLDDLVRAGVVSK